MHNNNWRAGASQPSRTTGTIFLYIYILEECLAFLASGSDPTIQLYIRLDSLCCTEKVFPTDLVCTGHIYRTT